MAITLFGSSSTPADNGTNTTNPTSVTPPSNMQKGDLVILWVSARTTGATQTINNAGGQTWNAATQRNQTYCSSRLFWCIFNGTWTANPSVNMGGTSCNIVRMLVFRGDYGTSTSWVHDVNTGGTYSAPASPYTVTIPSVTSGSDGELAVACWSSADDNTWGSLTSGWTALSPAQVRNTSGSDQSVTNAWKIVNAGAIGTVSQNQATLGGDAGCYQIILFRQIQLEEYSGSFSITNTQSTSSSAKKGMNSTISISSTSSMLDYGIKNVIQSININSEVSYNNVGQKGVIISFNLENAGLITSSVKKGNFGSFIFNQAQDTVNSGRKGINSEILFEHGQLFSAGGIKKALVVFDVSSENYVIISGFKSELGEDKYGQFFISNLGTMVLEGKRNSFGELVDINVSEFVISGNKHAFFSFLLDVLNYISVAYHIGALEEILMFQLSQIKAEIQKKLTFEEPKEESKIISEVKECSTLEVKE